MRKIIWGAGCAAAVILLCACLAFSATDKKKKDDLYKQVQLFADALALIQGEYVDDVSSKDLIYGSLKGMLSALDPHSQFLDPDAYNELRVDTEGKFGGLGIEITLKDGLLTVVTPIEGTPAWKAGIKSQDRIVRINNELTRDMSLTDAVKKLRGKVGEAVTVTVLREKDKAILDFKIVRDTIKIKDIKEVRILADGVGYIRLVEFREGTPNELQSSLAKLRREGMKSLIVDLRNNPGGLLDVAVKVTGAFILKDRLVVYTKGRRADQNYEFIADVANPLLDVPMVVLINEGSASGSEIVAGCLQDYKRAIIVGVTSFGKGSVQSILPLGDGSALRLTTSKYYTPSGQEIHGKGVTPDIIVEEGKIEIKKPESEEPKSEQIFEELEKKGPMDKPSEKIGDDFDYSSDNQLMRAVDILKGIQVFQSMSTNEKK